jgi:hypothetical protein
LPYARHGFRMSGSALLQAVDDLTELCSQARFLTSFRSILMQVPLSG